MTEPGPFNPTAPPAVCSWHPTRQTGLSCARCGRPACPECLREAAVGHQCIDCVYTARQEQTRVRRPSVSARLSARPVVTPVLIALNVLLYVVTTVQARDPLNNDQASLFGEWVLWPRAVAGADQWWRLLTSGFLHYGPIHIGVNMISLWILGRDLERILGRARFTAVYLVALLGGGVSVYLFSDSNQPTAGASGAIYGLLGGLLVVLLRLRLNPMPAIVMIVFNLILTVSIPNISLFGHLGGLVVGALTTAAIVYAPVNGRRGWQVTSVLVLVVALAALIWYRDAQLSGVVCLPDDGQLKCTPPGS